MKVSNINETIKSYQIKARLNVWSCGIRRLHIENIMIQLFFCKLLIYN